MKRRRILGGIAAVVAILGCALLAFTPGGRATLLNWCPACFGFTPVADKAYVQAPLDAALRGRGVAAVAGARARVAGFFGGVQSSPAFFICITADCPARFDHSFGAKQLGSTLRGDTILLSRAGTSAAIAAHEWSHAELRHRVGLFNIVAAKMPAWFDEGLAVVVAGDQRYLAPAVVARVCGSGQPELPATPPDWNAQAGRDVKIYARAGCRVKTWLDSHEGAQGLKVLIADMRSGDGFAAAFARETVP